MKTIQILMAVYNGEKFIEEQLRSIINQTNTEWELLIRDDLSTDSTLNIILEYYKNYHDRIRIIDNHGIRYGAAGNFMELLKISDSEYVMFADQDDVWLPDKIDKTLSTMKRLEEKEGKDTPLLVHTDLCVVDENLNLISRSMWKMQKINPQFKSLNRLLIQNNVTGCASMINKKLVEMSKQFSYGIIIHDWWIALIASCFGEIEYINNPMILYRQHNYNEVGAVGYNLNYIYKEFIKRESLKENLKKYRKQAEMLLTEFQDNLRDDQKILLEKFSNIDSMNMIEKRIFLIKNSILKYGFFRNVGVLLVI